MRKSSDAQQQQQHKNGFLPSSFRAISSYLRVVSSGASSVARSAASVAQSIVDREDDANDQVQWAGFDKLEGEGDVVRQVLLLGYRSGFQVWDVEEANNVRDLVSKHDGPVSFLQMLPKPIASNRSADKFAESRPLLVVCSDATYSGQDGLATTRNGTFSNTNGSANASVTPTTVQFYSLRTHSYVHVLKFRSSVYSVRCSSRIVAISQAAQVHCFNATTLEREYTILTNPMAMGCPGSGGTGYGPLAVGPRWLAYSGSPVMVSNPGRVSPQHLTPSKSFNGSLVTHYAKESSKQLAAGIVTLGDIGYKRLTRYYSELLPDSHGSLQPGTSALKANDAVSGHLQDADNIGMVVVRDIVSKVVISQFRAHKSPISALCFDPSGTLLVTASVQGHNFNVFKIMPGPPRGSSAGDNDASYAHLYRLQRGFTNAVIQDIVFSQDSNWIMISSSRGTSHLFAINPSGGTVNFQPSDAAYTSNGLGVMNNSAVRWQPNSGLQMHSEPNLCASGPPVTLSVVSRIRSGNYGWRGTVSGAAAAATGRLGPLSGAIASSFHNCKNINEMHMDESSLKMKYHLLVFSPSGSMIQYSLRMSTSVDAATVVSGLGSSNESSNIESDGSLVVEAIQKWNICQKQNRREREDNVDIYGENGNYDESKIYPECGIKRGNSVHPEDRGPVTKAKISPEEKHKFYISEAELQMHQACIPLWEKPEIYFLSIMTEGMTMNEGQEMQGETEIERIPTRTIEARSRHLVPVFDHLQMPKFAYARTPSPDNITGSLQPQRSGLSEHSRLSQRSSSGLLDSVRDSDASVAEIHSRVEDTGLNCGPNIPIETRGSVYSNDSPKPNTHATVNTRETLGMEAQLKAVNALSQGLKTKNHFEEEGDEYD